MQISLLSQVRMLFTHLWQGASSTHLVRCYLQGCRSWSVHLMYSNDQKLGQARTHPKQHHPVPQGHPFSMKIWLTTWSPQTLPLTQHSLDCIKMHTMTLHHTPNTMAPPTFSVEGATPPPPTLHSSWTLPAIAPGSSSSLTNRLGFGWARVRVGGAWKRSGAQRTVH